MRLRSDWGKPLINPNHSNDLLCCPFCGAGIQKHEDGPWFVDHYPSCWMSGRTWMIDLEQLGAWNRRTT